MAFEVGAITENANPVVIAVRSRARILNTNIGATARPTGEGVTATIGYTAAGRILSRASGGGARNVCADIGCH